MPKYWEKKICGIYKITHRESGMCYIGLSVHIFKRWNGHVSTKKKYKLHEAFDQFGINAFRFEVVEECDKKELRKREKWWIAHFDCVWPKGYNLNHGGSGTVKHSEKAKKKMSEAKKGKALPQEHCRKISETLKGKPLSEERRRKISKTLKGKPHSEERRNKISEAKKGKTCSEEHRRKISDAKKGKPQPKSSCPHCGKLVAANTMKQWHGDKCKHRDTTLVPD